MSISELENALMTALADQFGALGFKLVGKNRDFVRAESATTRIIHVSVIRHEKDVDVTIDLGIRVPAIERVWRQHGWQDANNVVAGAELGNLVDGRPHRWALTAVGQASDVATAIKREVERFGLDWFAQVSSPLALFARLEANDRSSWLLMPVHAKRCAALLASAVLSGNASLVQRLADDCKVFLEGQRDPLREAFGRFSQSLIAAQEQ